MGHLVKYDNLNLIKWTLQIPNNSQTTLESKGFTIQDRKCIFSFYSGLNAYNTEKLTLSIDFNEKGKFNPLVSTILGSSSVVFGPEKFTITGERKQIIWSSFNFEVRGTLMTFEMVILNEAILKEDKSVQVSSYMDPCVMLDDVSKDFEMLFQDGPNHDVEYMRSDETIRAHKNVLGSRYNVFASMLRMVINEKQTGQMKIQDMERNVFQHFLRFLCTGVVPQLTVDTALMFYEAADNVNALKKQCADYLIDNASPENACAILLMADRYNDPDFKKNIIEYIIKAAVPIMGEKWTDFCKENCLLANEVLNLYCRHLYQK